MTASCCGGFSFASRASTLGWEDSGETKEIRVYRWPDLRNSFVTLLVPLAREVDLGMRYQLLYRFARDLNSSLELDVVLRKAMDGVITLMKAARGQIVLVDEATGELSIKMTDR